MPPLRPARAGTMLHIWSEHDTGWDQCDGAKKKKGHSTWDCGECINNSHGNRNSTNTNSGGGSTTTTTNNNNNTNNINNTNTTTTTNNNSKSNSNDKIEQ